MTLRKRIGALALAGSALAGCAAPAKKPLIDPFPLTLPLVEAGKLDIEGHIVGQPRARDGIVYCATREGYLTAVVVPSRTILWRFKADQAIAAGPELGDDRITLRDDSNTVYVLEPHGSVLCRTSLKGPVTTAVREKGGRLYFGTSDGRIAAVEASNAGTTAWEHRVSVSITAGPVFAGDTFVFGTADGRLLALGPDGVPVWEFAAEGAIRAEPAVFGGRLYFGTEGRRFYCLSASSGKRIWSRRLQGAPAGSALVLGRRIVVAASNSVVFFLARRGGSIVSWEAVPSRIIYEPVAAGRLVLVTSAGPTIAALDSMTGRPAGQDVAAGPLAAGAIWESPFVVLIEEDEGSGRQRMVMLRRKG